MTEFTMDRLRENLETLKMKNTLEILDNYLERAVAEDLNIVDVLDHIFAEEAKKLTLRTVCPTSSRSWPSTECSSLTRSDISPWTSRMPICSSSSSQGAMRKTPLFFTSNKTFS